MDKLAHFEIIAQNTKRAEKFYQDVFGWQINTISIGDYTFDLLTTVPMDDNYVPKEVGGINGVMTKRDGELQHSIVIIEVPSVDSYIEKIIQAGGSVVTPKRKIGDMGTYARVKDTEGNIIGLWQKETMP